MNLFDLFVKIGVDDQASGAIAKLSKSFSSGLATAAKAGTAAVAAAAAGVAALTTASVNNYAEYEQLVGGVDTLFKDSSQQLQQYAANAYKTAGMSANDYMQTATSFAAALVNSLDGDTDKAVEAANTAITDMSDNANKMGTDMAMIQNAYQGFAKQNYTMLDNLKLGYGGTKTEMERLLADAQAISGIEYDISSYADIVNAIHVIQDEMGILGTTAAEASDTITGSTGSMRAAWSNLVTGIADDNADLGTLIDNFVKTVEDAFESNILPRAEKGITGVAKLVTGIAPVLVSEIPQILTGIVPLVVDGASGIVDSVVAVLPSLISSLSSAAVPLIADAAPKLIDAGAELLYTVLDTVIANKSIIFDAAYSVQNALTSAILECLPDIVALGLDLVVSLADGLAKNAAEIVPAIIDCVLKIVDTLTSPDTLSALLDSALIIVKELAFGLTDAIPQLVDATIQIISSLSQFLSDPDVLTDIIVAAIDIVCALGSGIIDAVPVLLGNVGTLVDSTIDRLFETDWAGIGKRIINSIWDGLKAVGSGIADWFGGLFGSGSGNKSHVDGSHASGLEYVPKNNYIASLHQGEAVLTAQDAEIWRSGRPSAQGNNITINIQSGVVSDAVTARDLAQRISEELQAITASETALIGGWS